MHCAVILHDYLIMIRHNCINIFSVLLLLDSNNGNCSLQLIAFDFFQKVVDFSAFVSSAVDMTHKALSHCVLLSAE